jgi:hypothetical protein
MLRSDIVAKNVRALRLLFAVLFATSACGASGTAPGPSAVILPDAAAVAVGGSQTFVVEYADVRSFGVRADGRDWTSCVDVDNTYVVANSIRLIARQSCGGAVLYVTADLGAKRSPLVAALTIQ